MLGPEIDHFGYGLHTIKLERRDIDHDPPGAPPPDSTTCAEARIGERTRIFRH